MNTDLQPNAEQPRLPAPQQSRQAGQTRKVNAFVEVCISVHLCLSVASSFQLPFLGSPDKHFLDLAPAVAKCPADQYTSMANYQLLIPCYTPHIPILHPSYSPRIDNTMGIRGGYEVYISGLVVDS